MYFIFFIFCLTSLSSGTDASVATKKLWDYVVLSVNSNSSNDLIKWDLQISRINRGVFGISGTLEVNTEITDEFIVETKLYRSARGNNDYQIMPLKVPKQKLTEFMGHTYATIAMESFSKCSNLPQSIDGKPPFLEKKHYSADNCSLTINNLPSYMPNGFYKLLYMGSGPVDYNVELIAEISTK